MNNTYVGLDKYELYLEGLRRAKKFLTFNRLPHPCFMTYEEATAQEVPTRAVQVLKKVMHGPAVGSGTGLYTFGSIFVNVDRTAIPVMMPKMRSWSWPGWKTDRTAIGVVAHETGHYVEHRMQTEGRLIPAQHGTAWRALIEKYKKPVSGYEPVPSEAFAETMRLFILNPDLLQHALPERYYFLLEIGLQRSEQRPWRHVLSNSAYFTTAERWIAS